MKINRIIQGLFIILIASSCANQKLIEEGNSAYQSGNYETALQSLEQVITNQENKGKKAEAEVYYKAGLAAQKLDQTKKAAGYLETAEDLEFSSPGLFSAQARAFQSIDNLSKEITALENYYERYPEGEEIDSIRMRLFETYVESENWNKAIDLWPEIEELAQSNIDLLTGYLIVNKELENDDKAEELASQILEMDDDNISALEWYAYHYFWKAENMYVREMKAYKNNRTTSQYKKLLKAWDQVWPLFRKSRDYFKKLYYIKADTQYAKYLRNIYTRMDQKDKAAFWEKRMQ